MSNSSPNSDSGTGKNVSFSNTVNRFSQYIKEKRARGTTMDLFPVNEKSVELEDSNTGRTINLFPQISSPKEVDASSMANTFVSKPCIPEPSSSQMTIFYGGNVIVFNDLPSDKAKEVMDLASNLELSNKKRKLEALDVQDFNSNQNLNVPNFVEDLIPLDLVPNITDMPMTRKASLHRFLNKRRDRLVGKGPARSDVGSGGLSKPNVEDNSWLGLGHLPVFQSQKRN